MYICIYFFIILLYILICFLFIYICNNNNFDKIKNNYEKNNNLKFNKNIELKYNNYKKPCLWYYWENIDNKQTPDYIDLCYQSVLKHCSQSFDIIKLDNINIYNYLPELYTLNLNFNNLLIAQKVDFYRIFLLYKFGGLYIDADTIVMRDPIEIIYKLYDYDYVGFGCAYTGGQCINGYGKPSNGIMASLPKGILITNIYNNLINKLKTNKKWNYYDLGKYVIWEELDLLIKYHNYNYYHFSNEYDSSRDINNNWIETSILFSNEHIHYKNFKNIFFIILYNSQMKNLNKLSKEEILNSNTNVSKFFKLSLNL